MSTSIFIRALSTVCLLSALYAITVNGDDVKPLVWLSLIGLTGTLIHDLTESK